MQDDDINIVTVTVTILYFSLILGKDPAGFLLCIIFTNKISYYESDALKKSGY